DSDGFVGWTKRAPLAPSHLLDENGGQARAELALPTLPEPVSRAHMSARVALVAILFAAPGTAQDQVPADKPVLAPAEKDRNEAARLHALGTLRKNQGLYLDAIAAFEACLKLDAAAVPPRKLLAASYRVVGRLDDAVELCKKVTDLAPNDFDGWQRYAE